ncbi:MAG: hypothetical protein AABZ65_01385 [Candidatus Omnitrophota bacterium]
MKNVLTYVLFISFIFLTFIHLGFAENLQSREGKSNKFEHTIEPGYDIKIVSPKEGQKFKPGDDVVIEIIIEGNITSPKSLIMLGKALTNVEGKNINTKLRLDDKYIGESELMIGVNSEQGFIGSKAVEIYVGDRESAEDPKWKDCRDANELEWSYMGIALDMKSPAMCYRISPRATMGGGFASPGDQIEYARSSCFYALATELKNKELCNEVKSISTPYLDGSAISKDSCIQDIDNNSSRGEGAVSDAESLLRKMGYVEADIPGKYRKNGFVDYFSFYLDIVRTEDFKQRLNILPDFSKEQ